MSEASTSAAAAAATSEEATALDSWEDLDDGEALSKVTEALEKIKLSKAANANVVSADPFEKRGKQATATRPAAPGHLVALTGGTIDEAKVKASLASDYGHSVRLRSVDAQTAVIILTNAMDARHLVKTSKKFAPLKLYGADELDDRLLAFIEEHRGELLPSRRMERGATNVSVIRKIVSRTLNVQIPISEEQRAAEAEQMRQLREQKRAKIAIWES